MGLGFGTRLRGVAVKRDKPAAEDCPCGSGTDYSRCCGRLHAGANAETAEALMRSRYSAFVVGDSGYLLRTWHPSTRPATLELDPALRWLGLTVICSEELGPGEAEVEFVARARQGSRGAIRQRERSRFRRESGRWTYLDGEETGSRR